MGRLLVGVEGIDEHRHGLRRRGEATALSRVQHQPGLHPGWAAARAQWGGPGVWPNRVGLMHAFYGRGWFPDLVRAHVRNLRAKIEKNSDRKYIRTIHGVGYMISK